MTDTPTSDPQQDRRRAFIDGLTAVRDLWEANPDLPVPYLDPPIGDFTIYLFDKADAARFGELARMLGGQREKDARNGFLRVVRRFGPLMVEVAVNQESVCERRLVETRVVERPVMEQVGVETVEEQVFEYDCPPVLAARLADERASA